MYSVYEVGLKNVSALLKVADILYKSGKDMAQKFDLHHWDNSRLKTLLIVFLCAMKNDIFVVCDTKNTLATFQTRRVGNSILFQKLATTPEFAGKGIGSFCIDKIEEMGRRLGCSSVTCEVYDESKHAINFYAHKGYTVCGTVSTLKYNQLKLRKELEIVK